MQILTSFLSTAVAGPRVVINTSRVMPMERKVKLWTKLTFLSSSTPPLVF